MEESRIFDIILEWCSLACSKLIFHPVEFPVHALTTFIQSNPTPLPRPPPLSTTLSSTIALPTHVASILVPHQFASESLWKLFKQKGTHIYDGGLVYLAHNMITIIFNFIQRYVSTRFNQSNLDNIDTLEKRKRIGNLIDLLLSLIKNGLTLPLDVLMTRLIVHRFYKSNNTSDSTLKGICKNEGLNGLYSGWEVILLKSILDKIFRFIDNRLVHSSKRGPFGHHEKSPSQILLLCIKILLDYILNVVKVRLNIRNIGFLKTFMTIYRMEGIRGLFSGLNTYFILFPLWMIGILFANVIFVKLKQKLVRTLPNNLGQNENDSDNAFIQQEDTGIMGVAITPLSAISDNQNHLDDSILIQDDDDEEQEMNENEIQENYQLEKEEHVERGEEEEEEGI